ncbi:MAG TPA: hypothetical protein PLR07_15740, partial [Promineifilum sp.]|nr:hypothetical protein [Promineifilum sp.]
MSRGEFCISGNVPANGTYSFLITVSAPTVPQGEVRHATLRMTSNRGGSLTFPITIVRGQAVVEMSKTCTPASCASGKART